jgi:hypothetical protein
MLTLFAVFGWGFLTMFQPQSAVPLQKIDFQIRVHAVDGQTGKPIANEHVLIFVTNDPQYPKARLIDRSSDNNGVVLIRGIDFRYIQVFVDWHILCIKGVDNRLEYSTSEVVGRGVSSGDSCGKIKVDPKPGDLYIFARPRHWWEPTSGAGPGDCRHRNRTTLLTAFTALQGE